MTEAAEGLSILQLLVLALVQGITEFLPISSSAHLILVPALTGWADQGLAMDVALHIGTLLAVLVYFRRDVGALLGGGVDLLRWRYTDSARLALQVAVATLPVMACGLLFRGAIAGELRSAVVIVATTAGFGLLLWWADHRATRAQRTIAGLRWRDVLIIGAAQALALIPGTSRSGITITAALMLGFTRTEAARFSLLLAIPTTLAAGTLGGYELWQSGDHVLQSDALIGGALAFVSALAAIAAMMHWLRRATFRPFVIYRLLLAVVLGVLVWQGVLQ
ncbi:MAG: undecaprenyl-diphosphate phosphatase [Oceanococcaceae bacterium]